MTVIAVSMVKDEADIVRETVGRMASQVDHVIVADNGSTDGTREILEELGVEVVDDPDPAYYQSQKMTHLAGLAREQGARWVVPFDADEIHLPFQYGASIAEVLSGLPDHILMSEAPLLDHVATAQDEPDEPPVQRMRWRRTEQAPLRKIAVRAGERLTIHQGNHSATFEGIQHPAVVTDVLQVRHFPYRSPEQMIRKARNGAAAYAATNLPFNVGQHWREYGARSDEEIEAIFREWFWSADPNADGLVYDPVPR